MISHARQSGFSLFEMAITLAIIVTLAAVLTPVVGRYVEEARITRAASDARSIGEAILNFNKTTGKWPIFKSPAVNITTSSATFISLETPGGNPQCSVDCSSWLPGAGDRGGITDILGRNLTGFATSGKFAWRGPYLTETAADPWGNKYLVNADSLKFTVNRAGYVLSAGPNGVIETPFAQSIGSGSGTVSVGGDDIVFRVR